MPDPDYVVFQSEDSVIAEGAALLIRCGLFYSEKDAHEWIKEQPPYRHFIVLPVFAGGRYG